MTPKSAADHRPETGTIHSLDLGQLFGGNGASTRTATPLTLVYIRAGTFRMGSTKEEQERAVKEQGMEKEWVKREGPQTLVTLSRDFWLGESAVTQGQYRAAMGTNPSHFKGAPNLPVEGVSWEDATEYCRKLTSRTSSLQFAASSLTFSLPTEAQWEFACRAGTTTRYSFGDDEKGLDVHAWHEGNSDEKPHPVKTRQPNPWGLYDLHGNVWEWCLDWLGDKLPGGSLTDPVGSISGSFRAFRGGSWINSPGSCRSAYRGGGHPGDRFLNLGFRLAAPVQDSC